MAQAYGLAPFLLAAALLRRCAVVEEIPRPAEVRRVFGITRTKNFQIEPLPYWSFVGMLRSCKMNNMPTVKEQLKPIILSSLRITDLTPEDLRDDQPLLGGELEIDSIDVLQLVLEIERHFDIKLVQGNFDQKHLESVNALAAVIESKVAEARS